jgi:molybdate transport system ATP-binding protein
VTGIGGLPGTRGIQCRFRLDRPGFVLDVDLDLATRGVTAIFGPSGSGKTTLLRCIAGLERAPNGRLRVGGEVWQDGRRWVPTHRRQLGYVFQEASLFPHLSVAGNLHYGLRRSAEARRVSLDSAVELLGLGHLLDRRADRLSGGERQRVAIARALATGPRLLLMDEPLAALDLERKGEILPYLERLHGELEIPVLYVSHSPDEVARLADDLVVLEGGRILASGPLSDLLARLDLPIRLGKDTGTILEGAIAEVDTTWHLARVEFAGGTLWTRDHGLPVGHRVRVRVLARDVSLARRTPERTSIQNVLAGRIDQIVDDEHPSSALVRIHVGRTPFVARLTKRAVAELEIAPGQDVWVQVKSVALLE